MTFDDFDGDPVGDAVAAVQAAAGQILDPASAVAADVGDGTITIGDIVIPGTYILRGGVVSASFEGFD